MANRNPGEIIGRLMDQQSLTAYAVAKRAGIDADTVRLIVSNGGQRMTLENFRRICAVLETDPAEVLAQLPAVQLPAEK
jgi:DNA-binding Xre family transcriptional regulator